MSEEEVDPTLPRVSVVVPALDAANTIEDCLDAVLDQDFDGDIDVTVAVGPGRDRTWEILQARQADDPRITIVANPSGSTAAGLNLAVKASGGEVVARVDAQAIIPPRYIRHAVDTLRRTGAGNVGGVQRPVGDDGLQRVIAIGMCSPFGAGPARFRRDGYEGPTDTVYLGVFRRHALEDVGGFDETLERNQDYELNVRLRAAGHQVWLDPSLVVLYRPRATFSRLASQYYQYGVWKRQVVRRHPTSLQPRQTVAPLLVIGLIVSAVEIVRGRLRGLLVPFSYAGAALLVARDSRRELPRKVDRYRLIAVFATMHVAWGVGFLFGRRPSVPGREGVVAR